MNETRKRGETRTAVRIRQSQKATRPTDPDGAAKNPLNIISHALQFRTAAGQNNLTADRPCKAKILERLCNLTHQMLQPLADHGDQLRTGDAVAFALIIRLCSSKNASIGSPCTCGGAGTSAAPPTLHAYTPSASRSSATRWRGEGVWKK